MADLVRPGSYIRFMGTAGSRWVVSRQMRASGGIYLALKGHRMYLDPGPGALVRCTMAAPPIDVSKLEAVILTHSHIDHCNDVNIFIDAMTAGGFHQRGTLYAPRVCVEGENPVVLNYLRPFLDEIVITYPDSRYAFKDLEFRTSAPHQHGTDTSGVIFDVDGTHLAFLVDTKYFEDLPASYIGVDILVVYATFLNEPPHPSILHLSVDNVKDIVRAVKPKRVVLTHLG